MKRSLMFLLAACIAGLSQRTPAQPAFGPHNWVAIGANGIAFRIVPDASGNVYAGGEFTNIGGSNINRIAKWDGHNWSSLGTGINTDSVTPWPVVNDIAFLNGA